MTDLANMQALALACQSAPGSIATLGASDRIAVANLRMQPQAITAENPEYTGSIDRKGPIVLGATWDLSFDVLIRGPGGSAPPAADAFLFGRALRSLGFTEQVVSAAVPVAAEALGGSGNTTAIAALGASATATDDLYTGFAIQLATLGTIGQAESLAMIHDYVGTGKLASIAQTAGSAYSGNYQIPKQLAYTLSPTGTPPLLTLSRWAGNRRYDFGDMAPSSARLTFPTSAPGATDYSRLSVTYSGELVDYADEAAPVVSTSLAIPPFKGGKQHVDGLAMGGSSFSIDLGLRTGFPPNPNSDTGADPNQLVERRRTVSLTLNQVAKSVKDFIAHANAQDNHYMQALYGLASGNYCGVMLSGMRFNFPSEAEEGAFLAHQLEAYIDSADKTVAIVFPYH